MILRAHVPVHTHTVRHVRSHKGEFIIDDTYQCRYLVGAGGTHCPVYKNFFNTPHKRPETAMICAVEKEYQCDIPDDRCHIWYFGNRLPGYAWYLPKGNGWLNIGIGGKFLKLKKQGRTIMDHWRDFVKKLINLSLIKQAPHNPRGHNYYLFHKNPAFRRDNLFVIGDAAGVSTLYMGEGVHAVISNNKQFHDDFTKFSLPGIFMAKHYNS
ncbi:MAG: FAD-dependent monooxygenase [Desulfobacterales bacterium]|nr:FAD-dependent monooxygenase [Desulfobacterales bacterium]